MYHLFWVQAEEGPVDRPAIGRLGVHGSATAADQVLGSRLLVGASINSLVPSQAGTYIMDEDDTLAAQGIEPVVISSRDDLTAVDTFQEDGEEDDTQAQSVSFEPATPHTLLSPSDSFEGTPFVEEMVVNGLQGGHQGDGALVIVQADHASSGVDKLRSFQPGFAQQPISDRYKLLPTPSTDELQSSPVSFRLTLNYGVSVFGKNLYGMPTA